MNIVNYWRNSLADADRLNPDFNKMKKTAISIDKVYFEQGQIPKEITEQLFGKKINDNQITLIEILICPITANIKREHSLKRGNHPHTLIPLWIPALLNKSGILSIASKKAPWIPRDFLDPCLSGVYPVATLTAMDEFLTKKPFEFEKWSDYWAHAIRMFAELTDSDFDSFEHDQYIRSSDSFIMPNEQITGATSAVQNLYDHIRENKPTSKLLNQFASIENQPPQIALKLEESFHLSARHLGQMGQHHALSDSQRESIHNWFNIDEGDLLALNGPPGTGKTTFLQTVISTAWIDAALKRGEPPITVVSSSNNQPVTNVIESFAKIQEVSHPLTGRWIPQVEGYGSYLAASSKKEKELKAHWQTIKMDSNEKKGLLASLENLDELSKAAHAYLEYASKYSGTEFMLIEDAVEYLHKCLDQRVNRIGDIIESYDRLPSSGSVMLAARKNTKISLSSNDGGMWLVEHRRCVPAIIDYCNELAYYGRLQPKRPPISSYPLPHMGYAHIPGEAKRRSGSLYNEIEADAIVSWIHRNQEQLIQPYDRDGVASKSIDQVVAIITPFFQQKKMILDKLAKSGLAAMKNITVGTVHALQGAERPVVIFSPVYDGNSASSLFFDAGVNMLNVAVSRAQDSFLVFGDMRIFDPTAKTPSGLLARYLFASEEQEIRNVEMPLYFKTRLASPVDHIHDLNGHRTMLAQSIRNANREVHIISPFLSANAIEADDLQSICKEAIERGIKITVYTDEALNKHRGFLFPHFIKAKEMLAAWGVDIVITKRVHSKALWVDKDMLIEGSFNWLSAVRKPNSPWCRFETSLIFRGDKVNEMIDKIKEDLEKRKLEVKK